jgi:hypothetical protein
MQNFGLFISAIIFMFFHFLYFFSCHLLAILSLYNFKFCIAYMFILLTISAKNGANFYMDYFAKEYEGSMA